MLADAGGLEPGVVRGLQERAAGAFPALRLERRDGWWLRHADGSTWWAASVLPHGDPSPPSLAARIGSAEEFYAGHGAPARFQISPGACPPGLDDALAARGYRVESTMSLRWAPTVQVLDRLGLGELETRLDAEPAPGWFGVWSAVHGGADPEPERAMLARVERPSAYVTALIGGEAVAVGRAVAEAGWAGVFGMATLPQARGKGAAGRVLAALAGWAADNGAAHMYLQVEPDNVLARRRYDRAGFTELCRYHYRTKTCS